MTNKMERPKIEDFKYSVGVDFISYSDSLKNYIYQLEDRIKELENGVTLDICAEKVKRVLTNYFGTIAKDNSGKTYLEVPEMEDIIKAIDIIEKYCLNTEKRNQNE